VRRRALSALLPLVLALCATAVEAAPDVIKLRNGGEIRGRIVEETETTVTIRPEIGGGKNTFEVARSRIAEIVRGDRETEEPARGAAEDEASFLVYESGRTEAMGWQERRSWRRGEARFFETVTVFLESKEQPRVRVHVVEEVGPDLSSRRFTYREQTGEKREILREGVVDGERLRLTEATRGETTRRTVPFPAGTLFPSAARAFVLARREKLPGGLETPVFDPRSDTAPFTRFRYEVGGKETLERDGASVEVWVLRLVRGE